MFFVQMNVYREMNVPITENSIVDSLINALARIRITQTNHTVRLSLFLNFGKFD